ncbi:glucose-1-phosphate adenylyltransferase [Pullulanibacillus sp. KACC 23026]|uniref:glucose-1-phosphate adenylyltransferase n=1 Tax=Pullulanibacillus sp. KACC 23026 TaxID=3028315 RepID=UPI0023B1803F|nr:glucose-1-phosphate adenylyltransferase [Pullulanibacillus sp. KACC 23026]WEG13831.1 glucose-1-phosphate adenylyltransferase [Pullulanibacillus sp. KACC 23026]
MRRKKWLAMLLAGGQGTRLGELTKELAKPAVPYGGKYRIIDFALSNCNHSGINTVGVLTQYQPHVLNAYIGNGKAWDLDRLFGGVALLPPYKGEGGGEWYKGTANAIYQNIHYIDQYNPEFVVVLSGDHIYKMNYNDLLEVHERNQADATIAVIPVPWREAHRFGIMTTSENGQIVEFQEKPEEPISNLASMGVYIFNWPLLRQILIEDEANALSTNDFGKDIIPRLLGERKRLFAYEFNGYWKDVGTIESLWEAHMDLIEEKPAFDLFDPNWKIFAGNANHPPQYIAKEAKVRRSLVNEGCVIYGEVNHSVISYNVRVGKGSVIKDSVIMPGASIGENVRIEKTIVGSQAVITDGQCIGSSEANAPVTLYGGDAFDLQSQELG